MIIELHKAKLCIYVPTDFKQDLVLKETAHYNYLKQFICTVVFSRAFQLINITIS